MRIHYLANHRSPVNEMLSFGRLKRSSRFAGTSFWALSLDSLYEEVYHLLVYDNLSRPTSLTRYSLE
jgi:hypothetical protein